jgi:hypothetical protein
MTPKGANLEGSDLLEVSTLESGSYVTRSITGQEIIDAAAGSGVTAVTGSNPIVSTGGTTPDISIRQSSNVDDGYLSASDWNTFNDKQNALTLTTTGTSGAATLVGATLNIPQYSGGSGGGLQGVHALIKPPSGTAVSLMFNGGTFNTINTTPNRLTAQFFIPAKTFTCSNLYINVTTLGAGVNSRILIYSDLNGIPNTKLYESSNLDCSTLGVKTATTSFTFNAGTTYWICTHCSGTATLTSMPPVNAFALFVSGISNISSYIYNITFGSAPTTLSGQGNSLTAIPVVFITAA